ncbi:hypothetical protein HMPREF1153_2352 [Selenomonas sp. CM52]|nr:hypothetical protein HMPREF1153_2352 [Selenomonas sp. CM52]
MLGGRIHFKRADLSIRRGCLGIVENKVRQIGADFLLLMKGSDAL